MIYFIFLWVIFILNISDVLSQRTVTTTATLSSTNKASITQFLVFSSSSETVIPFKPQHGWILGEEKKLRLYISGFNLQNKSIVFSRSSNQCTPKDFISSLYHLSSASIIELNVNLKGALKTHSSLFLCLVSSSSDINGTQLQGTYFTFIQEKGRLPFAAKICLILMLFLVSGFFSGLNLGLMSLSVNDLRLIAESDDSSMRHHAKRVLPLRKRGNYLLCSIVISNVLANALGTVLLDSLVHGLFAVIGSTVMIVLMGEIIPQAICSRYGLVIGSYTYVLTWICMLVTGLISYPLGFLLDKILGQEVTSSYTRDQIVGMLTRINADIEKPELDVITGVLSLRKKTVKEAMTWLSDVYMLDKDRNTDTEVLLDVHKHGFSRIPVYSNDRSNVIGIVKLRDFALITPEQYHLTVNHLLEFHTHPYGYAKTTDSLYNLMQAFLKARWHIALVQEPRNEGDHVDQVNKIVGVITLEDVIEEMLQREIIEETDMFTDNRHKTPRKRAKAMDYTALIKQPIKGPSISPQLKVAVFQFLSTNIPQFTSGFISQEILQTLLNHNVYATIQRQANQSNNSIYLYKKGFRYELFTLIIQGNATLESGAEHIISTVGPFSSFAASALLAEDKTVKDIHQLLDHLFTAKVKTNNLLDQSSSIFIPDYNLIINSELQILQIHRLVWLAAVRATQRQRSKHSHQKRMQPEQLLSNALDEISSITNVSIDKTNLTNFQRIFRNEKDIPQLPTQTTNETTHTDGQPSALSSVFNAIHSIDASDPLDPDKEQETNVCEGSASEKHSLATTVVICNPLLLTQPNDDPSNRNSAKNQNCNTSSTSNSLNEKASSSNMHINQILDDNHEHTIDDDHGQEKEHLIGQGHYINDARQQHCQ